MAHLPQKDLWHTYYPVSQIDFICGIIRLSEVTVDYVRIYRRNNELNQLTWNCCEFFSSESGDHAIRITLKFPTKTHPGGDNHTFFLPDTDGTVNSPYGVFQRYFVGVT
jgi:hypothetical protein